MYLTVKESRFAWPSKYEIETPDAAYYAQRSSFTMLPHVRLVDSGNAVVATLQRRWSLFRTKYDFDFSNGRTYRFWCEKVWKGVYVCENREEQFRLYAHKGSLYSVFQNDIQIAAIVRNSAIIGPGNEYEIWMNSGANVLVICSMILALNTEENGNRRSTLTIDFSKIGPQEKPFDESWRPT